MKLIAVKKVRHPKSVDLRKMLLIDPNQKKQVDRESVESTNPFDFSEFTRLTTMLGQNDSAKRSKQIESPP